MANGLLQGGFQAGEERRFPGAAGNGP